MGTASANPASLYSYSAATTRAAQELQDFVRTAVTPALLAYARRQKCLAPIDGKVLARLKEVTATDTWVRTVGQAFLEAGGGGTGDVLTPNRTVVTTDNALSAATARLAARDYRTISQNHIKDPAAAAAALAHMNQLMEDNRDDPRFAAALLQQMGQRGLLDMMAKLAVMGRHGETTQAAAAQRHLSSLLAQATDPSSPGHLDQSWVAGLVEAAGQPYPVTPSMEVTGWQLLEPLLQNPSAHFSTPFLTTVGHGLLADERKYGSHGKAPWATPMGNALPPLNLITKGDGGWDPMIGLLNALSRNPEAATILLDPNPKGPDKATLEYLLAKRGWPYDNGSHAGQTALGNALRAAAASHPSEPAQQRIAAELVRVLGQDFGGKVAAPLQPGVTDVLTAHIASGHVNDAFSRAPHGPGSPEFTKMYLQEVMADLAQNPDQYNKLTSTEIAYARLHFGETPSLTASAMAQVLGSLTHGRVAGNTASHKSADDRHNAWVDRISWGVDQALGNVPAKGTPAQLGLQGVQALASRIEASYRQDSSDRARLEGNSLSAERQSDLMNAVQQLARKTGHSDEANELSEQASVVFGQASANGVS
jgi:hypothetical protein